MTETEKKWTERVREWKASGQTAKAFSEGRNFKPSTLTYWAHRLRQKQGSAGAPAEGASPTPSTATAPPQMVRVRRTGVRGCRSGQKAAAEVSRGSSATMVIAVGVARIEVQPGFDSALLGEVVEALGGAR